MQNIVLRDAAVADAGIIAETIRTAFEDHRGKIDPPSSSHNENEAAVAEKIKKGGGVLATVDDALAGVVLYYPSEDGSLYLGRLAVLADFRGYGIGKQLVDAVEAKAKQGGYPRVTLAVRIQLTQNRQFFERLGYQLASYQTHSGYSEPTYMILAKSL